MVKVTKKMKRSKLKMKKKSSSRVKSRSSNPKKNSGAQGIKDADMEPSDIHQIPPNVSNSTQIISKLVRKVMKVKHIDCEDKAIRKAQRTLNKLEKKGSSKEIEDAKVILQDAINDKADAAKWMHPNQTIDKLNRILKSQIDNSEDLDIIETTKELLFEANESLRFINQGQEDTFFFQLIQDEISSNELKERKKSSIIKDIFSDDEESYDFTKKKVNKDTTQRFIEKMKSTSSGTEEREIVKKAERTLEIAQLSQSQEEIDDALQSLKEATDEMNEAEKYHEASKDNHTHLEYLNDFLVKQVERKEPLEAIQMTIFRIQQVKDALEESCSDEISENSPSIDKESDDESANITIPVIPYQKNDLIDNFEMETDILDDKKNDLDDGQKTPTSSGSNSKSVNVAQQMLENALKFQSPKEKMDRMKAQAKLNAKLRTDKIEKDRITQELNKKSSALKIHDNEEDQSRDSKKSRKSEEKNIIIKKKSKSKKSKSEVKSSSTTAKIKSKKNQKIISTLDLDLDSDSEPDSKSVMDISVSTSDSEYMSDETSNSEESENEGESENEDESESKSESESGSEGKKKDQSRKDKQSTKRNNSKSKVKQVKKTQTKLSVIRAHNKYYSVKLKVDKGNVPVKQLVKHLKALYKQLQAIDPSLVIYEYNSERPSKVILKPKDIPTDISVMKKFFTNINVKPNGGHTWFQVWLGHDDSVPNILTNMKYWSSEQDTHMYHKRLQQKYSVKDYWLMWSTERMDPLVLHQEVSLALSKMTKDTLHFSFSFGNIRKDPRFDTRASPGKFNKAMIIEAKKEQKETIYFFLGKLFSTSSRLKIVGMNMRMVPMINNDLPSHTKMKVTHLIAKQEQYLSVLRVKPCVYLQEIDYFNTALNITLRDIIMKLETLRSFDKEGDPMPVFTNVDYSEWHSCYVLTYPSHLEKEAEDYISQLPAFLHYVYGPEVLLMLTAEGQSKAQTSTWDPEKLCATSHLDLELDAVTSETSNVMWLPDLQTELVQFDTTNLDITNTIFNRATDADSISTFKPSADTPAPPIVSPPAKRNPPTKPSVDQIRESDPRDDENTTPKDAASTLGAPL